MLAFALGYFVIEGSALFGFGFGFAVFDYCLAEIRDS